MKIDRRYLKIRETALPVGAVCLAVALALLATGCEHKPTKEEEEATRNTITCQLAGERLVIRFDSGEARMLTAAAEKITLYQIPGGAGMYVRWMSPWDPATQTFVTGTPQALHPTPLTGHQCVIGTIGYSTSGCEHFGMSTTGNPTQTIYRWLVADPANPGQLKTFGSLVAIPAPVWAVQPPPQAGAAPVVVAQVDPPIPPAPAKLFAIEGAGHDLGFSGKTKNDELPTKILGAFQEEFLRPTRLL